MLLPSRRPRACALTALLFLLAAIPASASAAPSSPAITLDKQAAPRVLYGTDASVTLKAANPLGEPYGYNLTFRDVLPAGISYVAGSTPFAPTVIADQPAPGQTTLIWANIADLSPGSDYSFTYKVHHDPSAYTVGDTYTNNAGAYINTDPRVVPKFDAAGLPIAASATGSATDSATTLITAVKIDKSEPRPEGELLRGVHDHQTTYTLTVTNNQIDPTDAVVVDDYLPAGLEFLQCGGIDHTTDAPTMIPTRVRGENTAESVTNCWYAPCRTVSMASVNDPNRAVAASTAVAIAMPLVMAFVVLPTASSSVRIREPAGPTSPDISAMPCALSETGPKVSMATMTPTVVSNPQPASAMANRPTTTEPPPSA